MTDLSRRQAMKLAGAGWLGLATAQPHTVAGRQGQPAAVEILNPRGRVPLSFIIDDSTCLVNMGHFCTPQFAAAFPDRSEYKRPWKTWVREIPDSFVREFGEWCAQQGVKGKYSIVPNPACVGWLDRELPGWSHQELRDSLKLVRDLMVPNWDIHPEMITHTRVIDLKTGRPFEKMGPSTIENSWPREKKSVDELAEYIAYALRILKNCDLPCEGITTPGGFGNLVKSELSLAVQQAVNDVYAPDLVHYFKYVKSGTESTAPQLEHLRKDNNSQYSLTVNVPAGTGDWFGGWQGANPSEGYRYASDDASSGRMVELIQRGEPAVMLCHWPGLYCNGTKEGYQQFQNVVRALHHGFRDETIWMKVSEIARYWTAKELTEITPGDKGLRFNAPYSAENFTLQIPAANTRRLQLRNGSDMTVLQRVPDRSRLTANTFLVDDQSLTVCFDLARGVTELECR